MDLLNWRNFSTVTKTQDVKLKGKRERIKIKLSSQSLCWLLSDGNNQQKTPRPSVRPFVCPSVRLSTYENSQPARSVRLPYEMLHSQWYYNHFSIFKNSFSKRASEKDKRIKWSPAYNELILFFCCKSIKVCAYGRSYQRKISWLYLMWPTTSKTTSTVSSK